jgi:2-polyprenyl-3-methyl-5-hydroxy-6-metoxy-1,4-benzoquinol methylase
MNQHWKDRLYQAYVSSGQTVVKDTASAQSAFARQIPIASYTVRRFLGVDRGAKIVDLGCGHGTFLYCLRKAGFHNIEGVDGSPEQIAVAHRCGISDARLQTIASFLSDAPSESCDVVVLFDVLEHLTPQELFSTLDGVFRILRRGGRCIIHVPNAEGIHGMRSRYNDFTHELSFTRQSLRQITSTIGFSSVQCFEDRPRVHGLFSFVRRIMWDLGSLLPRLLLIAESGELRPVLSDNMTAIVCK